MRFVARIVTADGAPLAAGVAELRGPAGKLAEAKIAAGAVALSADVGPVWGLAIDGQPVLAVPVKADAQEVDLGEIALIPGGTAAAVFHAAGGRVFGAPRGLLGARVAAAAAPVAAAATTPAKTSMTFGSMLGSAAQQLTSAAVAKTGLALSGASISVKGIPIASDDAIGLEFPTAEVAASGIGLTELAFNLKAAPPPATATTRPKGPIVPDLTSYTRDLASRKLTALGLFGEITSEAVHDPSRVGRVVRQLPKPGSEVAPASVIRLFIGK